MKRFTSSPATYAAKYALLGILTAIPAIGILQSVSAQVQTGGPPGCGKACTGFRRQTLCDYCCNGSTCEGKLLDKCYEYCSSKPLMTISDDQATLVQVDPTLATP